MRTNIEALFSTATLVFATLGVASSVIANPMSYLREKTAKVLRQEKAAKLATMPRRFIVKVAAIPGVRAVANLRDIEVTVLGNKKAIKDAVLLFHGKKAQHLGRFCLGSESKPTSDRQKIEKVLARRGSGALVLSLRSTAGGWSSFQKQEKRAIGQSILAIFSYFQHFCLGTRLRCHIGAMGSGYRPLHCLISYLRQAKDENSKNFLRHHLVTVTDHDACYKKEMVGAYWWLLRKASQVRVNFIHSAKVVFEKHSYLACRFNNFSFDCDLPLFAKEGSCSYDKGRVQFWAAKKHALTLGGQLWQAYFNGTVKATIANSTLALLEEEQNLRVNRKPL